MFSKVWIWDLCTILSYDIPISINLRNTFANSLLPVLADAGTKHVNILTEGELLLVCSRVRVYPVSFPIRTGLPPNIAVFIIFFPSSKIN